MVRYGAEVCFAKLAVVSLKTKGFSGTKMVAFKATLWRTAWRPENRGATPYPFLFYRTMGSYNLGSPLGADAVHTCRHELGSLERPRARMAACRVRKGSCVTSITGPNGGAERYER